MKQGWFYEAEVNNIRVPITCCAGGCNNSINQGETIGVCLATHPDGSSGYCYICAHCVRHEPEYLAKEKIKEHFGVKVEF